MAADNGTREADCLRILESCPVLPDNHRMIAYLMFHKHRHAIVSTLVDVGQQRADKLTKRPPDFRWPTRRWEVLADVPADQIPALRVQGRVAAGSIEAEFDRKDWPAQLSKIEHPIVRDTAADVLRGWW